jgi:hypothetical protein
MRNGSCATQSMSPCSGTGDDPGPGMIGAVPGGSGVGSGGLTAALITASPATTTPPPSKRFRTRRLFRTGGGRGAGGGRGLSWSVVEDSTCFLRVYSEPANRFAGSAQLAQTAVTGRLLATSFGCVPRRRERTLGTDRLAAPPGVLGLLPASRVIAASSTVWLQLRRRSTGDRPRQRVDQGLGHAHRSTAAEALCRSAPTADGSPRTAPRARSECGDSTSMSSPRLTASASPAISPTFVFGDCQGPPTRSGRAGRHSKSDWAGA